LQADEDLGFLPGDVGEKFAPYFRPVYDVLQKRLGASFLEYCLKPEIAKVEIAPFAYMRGRTFENGVVILDEAQNVTPSQMKMFLTRMGENVTVIVNGDVTQCDLPG
ncbi:PhoH family protein, partial [Klebsiella pneumoniae]